MSDPCSWVSPLADSITALAAVGAAVAAVVGVGAWKSQLKGQHSYEVARRLYLAVLRVRDGVRAVRSGPISMGEALVVVKKAEIEIGSIDELADIRIEHAVYHARWEQIRIPLAEAEAAGLDAEVLNWEEVPALFNKLWQHIGTLGFAKDAVLIRRQEIRNGDKSAGIDKNCLEILEGTSGGSDPYGQELDAIIKEFRTALKKHLS